MIDFLKQTGPGAVGFGNGDSTKIANSVTCNNNPNCPSAVTFGRRIPLPENNTFVGGICREDKATATKATRTKP